VTRTRIPGSVATVLLWACTAYFVVPVWWLFTASTKSQGVLNLDPGLWFNQFQLFDNITALLARDDAIFLRWLVNSVLYSTLGAAIGTVLAVMVGYALSKYQFRGRGALFNLILAGVLVPPAALALPLFLMLSQVGLTNSYLAVLVPSIVSPLSVYLARVAVDAGVPDELVEAAAIDGAGGVRSLFRVAVPIIAPAMVTIFLFQFVSIWNNFMLPLMMLNSKELYPVTLGLYNWSNAFIQDATLISSVIVGSFLSIIPLLLGFILLQRYWTSGLTQGAVKH
jgi:multiple sugar transport system permease protein